MFLPCPSVAGFARKEERQSLTGGSKFYIQAITELHLHLKVRPIVLAGALRWLDLDRDLPEHNDQPVRDPARAFEVRRPQVHTLPSHARC